MQTRNSLKSLRYQVNTLKISDIQLGMSYAFSLYYYELGISTFFNEPLSIPELTGEAAHKLAEGDF